MRAVGKRAFDLSGRRGFVGGHEIDDWLQAERGLSGRPPLEPVNGRSEIEVRVALPGAIVVEAKSKSWNQGRDGNVEWSEFRHRKTCRRVPLHCEIDVDSAQAELRLGVLTVRGSKASRSKGKRLGAS